MGMPAPLYYTADMVRDLIDESRPSPRYELVYGELLVSPAPRAWHQEVVLRLLVALRKYLERERVGQVLMAPADISWGRPDTDRPAGRFCVPAGRSQDVGLGQNADDAVVC